MDASSEGVTSPCPQMEMPGDPGASFLVRAPLASSTNGMGESVRTWLVSRGKRKYISLPGKGPARPLSSAAADNATGSSGSAAPIGATRAEEEGADLGAYFVYDWAAYHAAFGDKPLDEAVTERFAEYAHLYSRMTSRVCNAVPPPMTLSEAKSIDEQAANFVLKFVTPLLGPIFIVKLHKLLAHVLDAIRYHSSLRNGNTSANEAEHKFDKAFYDRTSKTFDTFTLQLVRRSQGTREVLARIEAAEGGGATAPDRRPTTWQTPSPSSEKSSASTSELPAAPPASSGVAAPATIGGAGVGGLVAAKELRKAAASRTVLSVASLCARPGLSTAATLLGKRASAKVSVLSKLDITAVFDCGTRMPQLIRSTASMNDVPWYDAVHFDPDDGQPGQCVGEVRALVRMDGQDVALVREWEPVDAVPGCPMAARDCQRLKWSMGDDDLEAAVRCVPVASIRRLSVVVPDFKDLQARHGVDAEPPGLHTAAHEHRAMRFFLNGLFPWG